MLCDTMTLKIYELNTKRVLWKKHDRNGKQIKNKLIYGKKISLFPTTWKRYKMNL